MCFEEKKTREKTHRIDFSQKKEPIAFLGIRIIATKIRQTIEPKKSGPDKQKDRKRNKQEINLMI